jgi:hypothetical protein
MALCLALKNAPHGLNNFEPTQTSQGLHYNQYERFLSLDIRSEVARDMELRAKVVNDSGMFRSIN